MTPLGITVAILSDSPTLTTGFGRTTRRIADALSRDGYTVSCFGIKAGPHDVDESLPYQVWPAEQGGHWTHTLHSFFATVRPDTLILNMDAYNARECVDVCKQAGWVGPTVSYVCFDGLPVDGHYLDAQLECAAVWATSSSGASYLASEGINVAGVCPPGVDLAEFRPDPDPADLKKRAGLQGATVVGVFATNTERKQLHTAIAGFAHAAATLAPTDLRLYLHCRPTGYWDLPELAAELGVADRVIFPNALDFDEKRGVPTRRTDVAHAPLPTRATLSGLSYVDRINCCDVLVNVPHSGDVEQVILEGQACGVPILNTDDSGIMAEALAGAGIAIPAERTRTGRTGQRLHFVTPEAIRRALCAVLTDASTRDTLRSAGLANASSYPWQTLERGAVEMASAFTTPSRRP